jgi:hypothetical protein
MAVIERFALIYQHFRQLGLDRVRIFAERNAGRSRDPSPVGSQTRPSTRWDGVRP